MGTTGRRKVARAADREGNKISRPDNTSSHPGRRCGGTEQESGSPATGRHQGQRTSPTTGREDDRSRRRRHKVGRQDEGTRNEGGSRTRGTSKTSRASTSCPRSEETTSIVSMQKPNQEKCCLLQNRKIVRTVGELLEKRRAEIRTKNDWKTEICKCGQTVLVMILME